MKIKILKVAFYFMVGVWIGTLIVAFKTPQEILSPLAKVTPTISVPSEGDGIWVCGYERKK